MMRIAGGVILLLRDLVRYHAVLYGPRFRRQRDVIVNQQQDAAR
jgi:hypothetical protein